MASIGNLSATISANAQQFIAEFDRADNAAKRKTAAISKELDKLQTDIKKKFSVSSIGKDLLSGLGVGSALGAFNTVSGLIAENFRNAAAAAKSMQDAAEYTLRAEQERRLIGATEKEKLDAQAASLRELEKARSDLLAGTTVRAPALGPNGTTFIEQLIPASHEAQQAAAALTKQIEDLKTSIAEKSYKLGTDGMENALTKFFGPIDEQTKFLEEAPAAIREADMALREKLATESKTTEEVRKRAAFMAEEAAINDNFEIPLIDIAPPSFEPWTQYQEGMFEIFRGIGDRSAATFSEMVRGGENALNSLLDSVADAFLQLSFRMGVVNPLLNAAFGLTGSSILPAFFGVGAGKADGGQVNSGMMYPVGERGIEMFAPSTSGTIIPNHKLGGGGARNVYNIDARGATTDAVKELKAMMAAMNASIEPRSVAAVRDADRRRK